MRSITSAFVIALLVSLFLAGCQSSPKAGSSSSSSSDAVSPGAQSDRPFATLWINGMACPQCSYNVDLQLKKVAGVESVVVNMKSGMVTAYLSPTDPPTREQLVQAVADTTFTLVRVQMPGETAAR